MIRVYADWNVMSQMKNDKHPELSAILSNRQKFFNIFSTSHISDLCSSSSTTDNQQNSINDDLQYIADLTNSFCVYNNGKDIVIEQYDPKDLFNQQIEDNKLLNLSFDSLLDEIADSSSLIGALQPLIDELKRMPIDNAFQEAFNNPSTRDQMNRFFPGLHDDLTVQGLLNSISQMFKDLNESDTYKELREQVQSGLMINRDKMYASNDPFNAISKAYTKLGVEPPENKEHKYAPEWFNIISDAYIALDMHGFQEDKVKVNKGRKETFKNTTEDAFHAAYASTCDFYITNDKKAYRKSKEVFKKLNLNTIVFNPDEFVAYYNKALRYDTFDEFIDLLIAYIESSHYEVTEDGKQKSYYLPYFLFDYYNKIYIWEYDEEKKPCILLSRDKPTNNSYTYRCEVETLISKLAEGLGEDLDSLYLLSLNELLIEDWVGRKWNYGDILITLRILSGRLQLYFYFKD